MKTCCTIDCTKATSFRCEPRSSRLPITWYLWVLQNTGREECLCRPPRAMSQTRKKIGCKLIFRLSSGDIPVLTFPTPCLVDLLSRPFSLTRIEGKRANSILNLHISLPRVQQGDVQRGRRRLVWHCASSIFSAMFVAGASHILPTASGPRAATQDFHLLSSVPQFPLFFDL